MIKTRCVTHMNAWCGEGIAIDCKCPELSTEDFHAAYRNMYGPGWTWFVWVDTLTGLMPQAWGEVGVHQAANVRVLAKHPITPDDTWLNLDQLARKYPYESSGEAQTGIELAGGPKGLPSGGGN